MKALRHLLLALQFFTRIPVTGRLADWVGYSPQMLRASAAHLPAIGLLIGALAALLYGLLAQALGANPWAPLVAAVFSTVLTLLLTGAFHEDGLADLADGLGGSLDRARALEIMKDSRIGSFGASALVLALLAKVSLLALLGAASTRTACAGLLLAHVSSRALVLPMIRALPHVGDAAGSKSKPLAAQITGAALAAGALWWVLALALCVWLLPLHAVLSALALAVLAWLLMYRLLKRRLQGFTGDGLGATQQVCEIACYLGLGMGL